MKRRNSNICPYCKEGLIANRCDRCGYVKPFAFLKIRVAQFLLTLLILGGIYLLVVLM